MVAARKAFLWRAAFTVPLFVTTGTGGVVDSQLNEVTTIVQVDSPAGSSQASGFFYNKLGPADPKIDGPQWRALEKTWLVTNRHVVLSRARVNLGGQMFNQEFLPSVLRFSMRRKVGERLEWEPIALNQAEVVKRAKCHPDPEVDVCVIEVGDILNERMVEAQKTGAQYFAPGAISKEMFPGDNNKLSVEAGDAVIVAGYPKGFYDSFNLFPVLKAGVIGSRWGAQFKGKPCFLIDGQMFPGSSGSLVISRPTNITVDDGKLLTSKDKQFAVLGILSGEWWDESGNREYEITTSLTMVVKGAVNTAIVWYGSLIEDIISSGSPPTPVGPLTPKGPPSK